MFLLKTVPLNYEEIKQNPQRITKIETIINIYNWLEIKSQQKEMIGIKMRNLMLELLLILNMLKKKKYVLLTFQKITQTVKNKLFF